MGAFELPGGAPSASLYPRVIAVLVSGSASLHADFSIPGWASDSDPDPGGGSGEQLRTVPVGGADRITVWFDRPVDVAQASGTLTGNSSNPATTYTSLLFAPSGRWGYDHRMGDYDLDLDVDYDCGAGLHSVPAKMGIAAALWLARGFHVVTIAALIAVGMTAGLGAFYFAGVLCAAVLLLIENSLVQIGRASGRERV